MATFSCRPVLPSSMHLSSQCTGAAKTSPKGGVVRVSASGATTTSDKASQKKKHNAADPRKVVILGGGIQGTATAYFLSLRGVPSTIVERVSLAAAASGKAGGFLAGGWGDGGVTEQLHRVSFKMHEELAETLRVRPDGAFPNPGTGRLMRCAVRQYRPLPDLSHGLTVLRIAHNTTRLFAHTVHPHSPTDPFVFEKQLKTYRKIPTLSVAGGASLSESPPPLVSWLDGEITRCDVMDRGTAQVTPKELVDAMHRECGKVRGARTVFAEVVDVVLNENDEVVGVDVKHEKSNELERIEATHVVVAMGPWSVRAETWFEGLKVPMTGIKSVSLLFKANALVEKEPAALFCAEGT